jgi:hypothetical protein
VPSTVCSTYVAEAHNEEIKSAVLSTFALTVCIEFLLIVLGMAAVFIAVKVDEKKKNKI